jgi:NhaA family Na+:H+ antiporter
MADSTHSEAGALGVPVEPIQRLVSPLVRFLHVETASGIVLLVATAAALVIANSPFADSYRAFWDAPVILQIGSSSLAHSVKEWVNDGLMVLFFFVVGLEVKREAVLGELRDVRRAALPIVAALGGMIAPAAIYFALQHGQPGQRGWGIPMATDIAFVVGCMALLGPRVPHGLRVLLLTLAIADDIGSILVIAIGYTDHVSVGALVAGLALIGCIAVCSRLGVRNFGVYTLLGLFVWLAFLKSGIHATLAGVVLGLLTPAPRYLGEGVFGRILGRARQILEGDWETEPDRVEKVRRLRWAAREMVSPLEYLEQTLHPWVGFAIMPIFALANAAVPIDLGALVDPLAVAVLLGLLVGKPVGILLFSGLAVRTGLARLPEGVTWPVLVGGACLGGIGFTMALFIAELALPGPLLDTAKIGVLAGSVVSAALGTGILLAVARAPAVPEQSPAPAADATL